MSDRFVEEAQQNMGAVERLIKGLPGISGYVDKELRRDADKRVREMVAGQLEEQKQSLLRVQQTLLKGGGLKWMDDVDGAIQKLQIVIDRIKTASYGYAGFFDPVRIKEEQLNALYRFDVALASRVAAIEESVKALGAAVGNNETMGAAIDGLVALVADLGTLFNRRQDAIVAPDLLMDSTYAPAVDEQLLQSPNA